MDERRFKDIVRGGIPDPDENARKRAVNLALAEFEAAQTRSKKSFQGIPFLTRLMDRSKENPRREKMNKKLIYGGMATAMVAILAIGVTHDHSPSELASLQKPVMGGKRF